MTDHDVFDDEDLIVHTPKIALVEQLDLFGNPSKFAIQVDRVIVTGWFETKEAAWDDFDWNRFGRKRADR